jgi:hypothetical protein
MKKIFIFLCLLLNSSFVFANTTFEQSLSQAQYLSKKEGNIGIDLFLIHSDSEEKTVHQIIQKEPNLFIRESIIILEEKNHQYILKNWDSQCLIKSCVQNPFVGNFYQNFLEKNQRFQNHLLIVYNNQEQDGLGWFEHWNQNQQFHDFIMRMRQRQIPDHTFAILLSFFVFLILTVEVSGYLFYSHGEKEEVKRIPPMF